MSSSTPADQAQDPAAAIRGPLGAALALQRAACREAPCPGIDERRADLLNLKRLVSENREALIDAINRDYGSRSRHETLLTEVLFTLETIGHALKRLESWMKPRRRHVDLFSYPGARNRVIPQPLGVVGVIVPWNFPLQLSFAPLSSIFAAGNRAMVKMSENSRHLSRELARLRPQYFPPEKLQFFEETGGVGIEFSQLPFDHLLFTGSGQTGRAVMAACARNLTPVTLELGGKSPAIVAPDFPLERAAARIMYAKLMNAGQACVAVDYCFVPRDRIEAFSAACRDWVRKHYPDIRSPDYTSIIDDRSFARLQAALADAANHGARLVDLTGGQAADPVLRKLPPHLVLGVAAGMQLMQREIFGPILPVLPYDDPRETVEFITARDRPLAFYPFTRDRRLQRHFVERVMSGGVTVNDGLMHVAQHDLPFGGVGPSGMGHYHGREGFETFSKLRPVFTQGRFSAAAVLAPPYGRRAERVISLLLRLRR